MRRFRPYPVLAPGVPAIAAVAFDHLEPVRTKR
jgi:hypothetical protein